VVVGTGAGKDADVFGDAPNIAARVQEAAAPGTVLVTEDTHRLVSGLFVVEARGAPALKGVERPSNCTWTRQQEASSHPGHLSLKHITARFIIYRNNDGLNDAIWPLLGHNPMCHEYVRFSDSQFN
jgi:class 3 adenylate cyclase